MVYRTTIKGQLSGWYNYQGYLYKTTNPLTTTNNIVIVASPGQGQLGTDLTTLSQVPPDIYYTKGNLPETVNGYYITYIVPQYPNWVNAGDTLNWIDKVLPTLGIPYKYLVLSGLSLGGLSISYITQATTKTGVNAAIFYDGDFAGFTNSAANITKNCPNILLVANSADPTVNTPQDSTALYNSIEAVNKNYNIIYTQINAAVHDSWTHGWDPTNIDATSIWTYLKQTYPATQLPSNTVPTITDYLFSDGTTATTELAGKSTTHKVYSNNTWV